MHKSTLKFFKWNICLLKITSYTVVLGHTWYGRVFVQWLLCNYQLDILSLYSNLLGINNHGKIYEHFLEKGYFKNMAKYSASSLARSLSDFSILFTQFAVKRLFVWESGRWRWLLILYTVLRAAHLQRCLVRSSFPILGCHVLIDRSGLLETPGKRSSFVVERAMKCHDWT